MRGETARGKDALFITESLQENKSSAERAVSLLIGSPVVSGQKGGSETPERRTARPSKQPGRFVLKKVSLPRGDRWPTEGIEARQKRRKERNLPRGGKKVTGIKNMSGVKTAQAVRLRVHKNP